MTKRLYLPLLMALVVALSSCSSKMGELSSDYFTVTLRFLKLLVAKFPPLSTENSLKSILTRKL